MTTLEQFEETLSRKSFKQLCSSIIRIWANIETLEDMPEEKKDNEWEVKRTFEQEREWAVICAMTEKVLSKGGYPLTATVSGKEFRMRNDGELDVRKAW